MDFAQELRELLIGRKFLFARREADWELIFGDDLSISVGTFWRLRDGSGILVTDSDHGHQFGLPSPVNSEAKANEGLKDCCISDVDFDRLTGDLTIYAGRGLVFEIITSSMGYESWQLYSANGFEAAIGNGGLR